MKKTINIILGLFVAASLVYLVVTELRTPETKQEKKTVEKKSENSQPDRLNIYYFHGSARCNSCLKIEKFTKSAIGPCHSALSPSPQPVQQNTSVSFSSVMSGHSALSPSPQPVRQNKTV